MGVVLVIFRGRQGPVGAPVPVRRGLWKGLCMFVKRAVGIALGSIALTVGSLSGAPAALAHTPIACTGQESTSYSPGLTLGRRATSVVATGTYTCADRPGHTVPAATRIEGAAGNASCLAIGPVRGRETVRYGDGRKSVIEYLTGHSDRVLGFNTVRLDGVVVEGLGKGARAERIVQTEPADLPTACLTAEGLRSVTAHTQLRILP